MKQVKQHILRFTFSTVLFIVALLTIQAHPLPDFRIVNAGLGKQFGLSVAGLADDRAVFELKTVQGEVLLTQRIRSSEFNKLYSVEALQEGRYLLVLRTVQQMIVQPVRLTKRTLWYDTKDRQVILTPEVQLDGRQLDVNYDNPDKIPFTIRLRGENGTVLYEQRFDEREEIEQRINLLQLPAGTYLLDLRTDNRRWQQDIVLR